MPRNVSLRIPFDLGRKTRNPGSHKLKIGKMICKNLPFPYAKVKILKRVLGWMRKLDFIKMTIGLGFSFIEGGETEI